MSITHTAVIFVILFYNSIGLAR